MDVLENYFAESNRKKENVRQKLPEALSKQKKKFLISLKKCDEQEFTKNDEDYVKEVMHDMNPVNGLLNMLSHRHRGDSRPWYDSLVNTQLNSCLDKYGFFELTKYLDCAKLVFLTYSGKKISYEGMAYVLRHARQYGDASQNIFESDNVTSEFLKNTDCSSASISLPNSKFMNKVERLIQDLRDAYDESKFRCLNTNATYITLLILRRVVKNKAEFEAAFKKIHTHDSYVKLCPWPLDSQLPVSDISMYIVEKLLTDCVVMAIHAYLKSNDERTKRVLRVTCVQYMEWNGLHLPNLFFKVADLYNIDIDKLWDLLSTNKTNYSLMVLANVYYEKYQALKDDPTKTQDWFPYCRVVKDTYHNDLAATENIYICIILAYLIDLKLGFDISTVRLSHWCKSAIPFKREVSQKYAEQIHTTLTS